MIITVKMFPQPCQRKNAVEAKLLTHFYAASTPFLRCFYVI